MRNHILLAGMLLVLGTGCGGQSGTEILPNDAASCVPQDVIVLTDLDALPEGFVKTPNEVLAAVAGDWQGDLNGSDGNPVSTMNLSLAYEGGLVRLVRSVLVDNSNVEGPVLGAPDEALCPPLYEIAVQLTFSTADARLLESAPTTLLSANGDLNSFFAQIPLESVVGSARPIAFNPAEFDSTNLQLSSLFSEDRWNGEISWSASRVEDSQGGTSVAVGVFESLGSFSVQR